MELENSIESTLDKIKQQEHAKEIKLKEKREYETTVLSLNRSVRDATAITAKLKQEHLDVSSRLEALCSQLILQKSRQSALSEVLEIKQNELRMYQEKCVQGISTVWNSRSLLCESVHKVSDQCDVWALFAKPKIIQLPVTRKVVENNELPSNDAQLKRIIEKHRKLKSERDRLDHEPNTGEEFMRLKNALQYSASMAANYH